MKARAQDKAAEMKVKATEVSGQLRQNETVQRRWPLAAAVAGVGALIIGSIVVWRRRKT